jgi:hypothetical protein
MSADSTRRFDDSNAAQQRFLSLFLRSEREIFRYVDGRAHDPTEWKNNLYLFVQHIFL